MANILLTSAGRRVELIRCFQKARKNLGLEGRIIACDISPEAPALQFADAIYLVPRICDSQQYVTALASISKTESIDLIVPTIDTELALLASPDTKALFLKESPSTRILISSSEVISICRDKRKTAAFFSQHNIPAPHSFSEEELDANSLSFPLFVKPCDGSSSISSFLIKNQSELNFFRNYVSSPIVQECLVGAEYTIDVFFDFACRVHTIVPRQRLATRAGEILKGRINLHPSILASAHKLAALLGKLGAIGPLTLQGFLCPDGIFRFTEINPRFGGGVPMSIAAGADSCQALYSLISNPNAPLPTPTIRDGVSFSRFDQTIEIIPHTEVSQ